MSGFSVQLLEAQGWSLNPGRYVGVAEGAAEEFEFSERLEELNEEESSRAKVSRKGFMLTPDRFQIGCYQRGFRL